VTEKGLNPVTQLFDKIPDEFFSPLSRKYKSIYSYALLCLYHLLRTEKTDIRRSDYASLLKSQGNQLLSLFNVEIDQQDDPDDTEKIPLDPADQNDKAALVSQKVNYLIRKLASCGWFILSKDNRTGVEYLFIPAYSIQFMRLLDELTSDLGSYLPLVHQTYAELKMEDDKEDDYMYRSLMNAKANAENLEMSVTLLRQQICVFGNRLSNVFDPNEALKQHFDEYRADISDRYYHPMKTFDSLGLYSQPTLAILTKWLHSERVLTLLAKEAKTEPINSQKKESELVTEIIKTLQDIIDIFSRITHAFDEIDKANANYTEAVQRKVNYLASSDKTTKGKIDKIILALATEIKNNPALSYEEMPILTQASETLLLPRQGFVDSGSMTMPFKRGSEDTNSEPMPLDDEFDFNSDDARNLTSYLDNELDLYSDKAITDYVERNLSDKKTALTTDFEIKSPDQLVLYILGVLKSLMGLIPFTAVKVKDRVEYAGYYMPLYRFTSHKH
jgi:hypothetical protein